MTRAQATLLLFLLWAGIFLPGLGSPELKGEEGRRILPAVTMLETGEWIVPYVGGLPFLRKPPLVNWLIAGSFAATGVRNEWTARLPNTLALLALLMVLAATATGRGWIEPETAVVAGVLALLQAATFDKGRLAEIDILYSALTGMAVLLWLSAWAQERSAWRLWLPSGVLLGVAALAKLPLHFIYFYVLVAGVLWAGREWRLLLSPAHGVAVLLMGGIFAAWAIPYFRSEAAAHALEVWRGQSAGRVGAPFDLSGWLRAIPNGLADRLPALLFAPLLWRRDLAALGPRRSALFRGARLATLLCFFGTLLTPGLLPRYTLPLLTPLALLLALVLADERLAPPVRTLRAWGQANTLLATLLLLAALATPIAVAILGQREKALFPGYTRETLATLLLWPLLAAAGALLIALTVLLRRHLFARPALLATVSGALAAGFVFLLAGSLMPFIRRSDDVRPLAATVDALVPPGQTLLLYDPEYQPAIFYLRTPYRYAPRLDDIPPEAHWLLAREEKRRHLLQFQPEWQPVQTLGGGKLPKVVLLHRGEG